MIELTQSAMRWSICEHSEKSVAEFVDQVLKLNEGPRRESDRRRDKRVAFPHLLTLTPISDTDLTATDEPVTVVGKQLAARGLDFYHNEPLGFKRAIVSFDTAMGIEANFVISISWCRFLRPGWYDSGGRFTHYVTLESDDFSVL